MLSRRALLSGFAAISGISGLRVVHAADRFITVVSTHTTQDSGLLSHIGPMFTAKTGITVRFVIFGTGQALDTARRGDADLVFSHDRIEEERFIAEGFGVRRHPVMYNDFVLIGPKNDPLSLAHAPDLAAALEKLWRAGGVFISRGDRSGTHLAELRLWQRAAVDITRVKGSWYREIGQGMGAALNMAAMLNAHVLSDRGTWLNFRNRQQLGILVEGRDTLRNQYATILVNPARHPHVKVADAQLFIDWLIGPQGQQAIADYRIHNEPLFQPNAAEPGA